nr:hypothetical protein [Tanacetum cinerariifolium]
MVVFLSKSDASTCFDQIVDFLNAHTIQYALVVNPTIYVSCIKQFCATAIIKKCVSAKRTTWNEFSCSMASAVICLATELVKVFQELRLLCLPQYPTPTPHATPPASPPQEQPSLPHKSSMSLLNTLMETCATLSNKEIHSEGSRTYWKIIKVSRITKAYQSFKDMLKGYDKEDLIALWNLVKENFSSAVPSVDKEKALWVKLKRLFEPDADDVLWKLQRHDMFMLIEKDYPLSNGVMTPMLSAKLQVKEDSEMARDLVMKIFMEDNKQKSKSLDTSSK